MSSLTYHVKVKSKVNSVSAESGLLCLFDLLNAAPELFAAKQLHLLEPLGNSLKDVSEVMRINVAQIYGIIWAYGLSDEKFDQEITDCLHNLTQRTLEHKHGWLLVLGHTFNRKIEQLKQKKLVKDYEKWTQFVDAVKIIGKSGCELFLLSYLLSTVTFLQLKCYARLNGCLSLLPSSAPR